MLSILSLKAGSQVLIGSPSHPVDPTFTEKLKASLKLVDEVVEAHMPNVYAHEVFDPAHQVVVLVFADDRSKEVGMAKMEEVVGDLALPDQNLDLWPMLQNNDLLPTVREAKCKIK